MEILHMKYHQKEKRSWLIPTQICKSFQMILGVAWKCLTSLLGLSCQLGLSKPACWQGWSMGLWTVIHLHYAFTHSAGTSARKCSPLTENISKDNS